jgi:hypothetical protein
MRSSYADVFLLGSADHHRRNVWVLLHHPHPKHGKAGGHLRSGQYRRSWTCPHLGDRFHGFVDDLRSGLHTNTTKRGSSCISHLHIPWM